MMKRILLMIACSLPLLLPALPMLPDRLGAPSRQFQYPSVDSRVKILALDGGGVRGVASLTLLSRLQQETGCNFHEDFEIFAGTSTGSMIAVFLALGVSVDNLLTDYETMAERVFAHKGFGIFSPEYDPEPLKASIIHCLHTAGLDADATLGDVPKTVVIPSVLLCNPKTNTPSFYCFENISTEGKAHRILDVLLSATAAPTYFPSHDGRIDGGTGMNDPSLAALAFAFKAKQGGIDDYLLFSVGTGYIEDGIKGPTDWGILDWLFNDDTPTDTPLISVMCDLNDQIPFVILSRILGESYKRFNFPLQHPCALDDYEAIPALIEETDEIITAMHEKWSGTCDWITSNAMASA
jgi:Patatin-like phospholipase